LCSSVGDTLEKDDIYIGWKPDVIPFFDVCQLYICLLKILTRYYGNTILKDIQMEDIIQGCGPRCQMTLQDE
jgi:hypothetical protein